MDFSPFRICVTAPSGSRTCRQFRLRASAGDIFTRRVRWSSSFPDEGIGVYRVAWRRVADRLGQRLSFGSGPTIRVSRNRVPAGQRVRIFGSAEGCAPGGSVTLLSEAFSRRREFAGVPAVFTRVRANGRYSVRVRIPRSRDPGRYEIGGRCGGGNWGIFRAFRVLAG